MWKLLSVWFVRSRTTKKKKSGSSSTLPSESCFCVSVINNYVPYWMSSLQYLQGHEWLSVKWKFSRKTPPWGRNYGVLIVPTRKKNHRKRFLLTCVLLHKLLFINNKSWVWICFSRGRRRRVQSSRTLPFTPMMCIRKDELSSSTR